MEVRSIFLEKKIDTYSLRRPEGHEIKHLLLNSWKCIKRADLISFLYQLIPNDLIKEGRVFSHFIYEGDKIVAAEFTNGEIEYGDIFVGADGGNSKVRHTLFGNTDYTKVGVKEVVGICKRSSIDKKYSTSFTKFQNSSTGLAFGLIPTSEEECVWFLQYDPTISDIKSNSPEELRGFCYSLLEDFPPIVQEVLDVNDYTTSYVWNTRDFDLLPTFHKNNVVIIGDAAHLALPFTSAGTTNAIVDAKTLTECLTKFTETEDAFEEFYRLRSESVGKHIQLGRDLKEIFLNPLSKTDDDIPVPLIAQKEEVHLEKEIEVLYFTDPICSTCWIIQPLLRKLKLEYNNYLDIKYSMGGLLPSWEGYNKGMIKKPSDAAKHWEEVCAIHEMPLDGDVWLEDPLTSSYPPSIAFKAAQMQDTDKAILFLRRIKEMLFLEKKNIIKWEYLETAAFEVGLDSARLARDFEGKATELFKQDLEMADKLNVSIFPTLIFSNRSGKRHIIKGYQHYDKFEDIIGQLLPHAKKEQIDFSPSNLFMHFPSMTDKEFAFISSIPKEEATETLYGLLEQGLVEKMESKNGTIWISKFAIED
jgi:predicted DsbA family dithiol-disulfide isomerase